jgi:hypothetical protein
MRQAVLLALAVLVAVGCGVSDQDRKALAREVRDLIRSIDAETRGFGSEQQVVEGFLERREKEFDELKASLEKILGGDKADNLDLFYLKGLLEDLEDKGDDLGFEQAKRQTLKRLEQLKSRIEKL